MNTRTILLAGVPAVNQTLYHRMRFLVGDAAAVIETVNPGKPSHRQLIIRDIEVERARKHARADAVGCPAEFAPASGLSGDRDTAVAQSVAEYLRSQGIKSVVTDRSLPYIFAHHLQQAGIGVEYDPELGVRERRVKDDAELDALREAQRLTHEAMRTACEFIASAPADRAGVLQHDGAAVTSQSVRRAITRHLLDRDCSTPYDSIVATLPHVADCHHHGDGALRTGLPVIVDIFPRHEPTRYWGDCTRTVVHGEPTDELRNMHAAVVEAKRAGTAAMRPGITGEDVHRAVVSAIESRGYAFIRGNCGDGAPPALRHGTGHGIGLDVHEPILLDFGGGEVLEREVFTVEPGLYSTEHGGVRVEDMVVVRKSGAEVFGELHEGLDWR